MGRVVDVFFSYSHADEQFLQEFKTHVDLLRRQGLIRTWSDGQLVAGEVWAKEICAQLEQADVVLLLVSAEFLASDFCFDVEMARALERHEVGEARLIPVILRSCEWQQAPFRGLQVLPKDGRPIAAWESRDEAWLEVTLGLRATVTTLLNARLPSLQPEPAPSFPQNNPRIQELSEALDAAHRRRAELICTGRTTSAVDTEILHLRRELREGGRLGPGDFLLEGRLQLLKTLGQGGFARVWQAYDRQNRELVAVKVLHGQFTDDLTSRERFFRGARAMTRLLHPGIVNVQDRECEDDGFHFFVMEYVEGGDFRQAVLSGRLSLKERLRIILEVGEALQHAHEKGLVHRDVKPANILLDTGGRAKLTDFDLVWAADTTGGTLAEGGLGTAVYAAPEAMYHANEVGPTGDVYSLAMTGIFALLGADLPPEEAVRRQDMLIARLEVPQSCQRVLSEAVSWEPTNRPKSMALFCNLLHESLKTEPMKSVRGQDFIEPVTGEHFLWILGGQFQMGGDVHQDEQPAHPVQISPFWLAETPVTNRQYAIFLKETHHEQPSEWKESRFSNLEQPVLGVSWHAAVAYCRWLSDRACLSIELPTEAQWEFAARGSEGREYPWGNAEPDSSRACFAQDRPTLVGSAPAGRGPFGTLDQAGNVWEWCQDVWVARAYALRVQGEVVDPRVEQGEDGEMKVLRGGCWHQPAAYLRAAVRYGGKAAMCISSIGFRVCAVPATSDYSK